MPYYKQLLGGVEVTVQYASRTPSGHRNVNAWIIV